MKYTIENLFEEFEIAEEVHSESDRYLAITLKEKVSFLKEIDPHYERS